MARGVIVWLGKPGQNQARLLRESSYDTEQQTLHRQAEALNIRRVATAGNDAEIAEAEERADEDDEDWDERAPARQPPDEAGCAVGLHGRELVHAHEARLRSRVPVEGDLREEREGGRETARERDGEGENDTDNENEHDNENENTNMNKNNHNNENKGQGQGRWQER